jgi:hypothetical protein
MADAYQHVQYIGPKEHKVVTFLTSKPAFNEGNNWTAVMDPQEAGQLMRQCADIFRVVSGPNVLRPQDKEDKRRVYKKPEPEESKKSSMMRTKKGVETPDENGRLEGDAEEGNAEPKEEEGPTNPRIYGKADGSPFNSVTSAASQILRIAKKFGLDPDKLEVAEFADGIFVVSKEDDEEE